MGNGRNIITEHLSAFCGGAFGSAAVFFKPILLDATRSATFGFWQVVGFYAMKLLIFSVTTALGGLLTAWGADLYKNRHDYLKFLYRPKGKKSLPEDEKKKDKAA